MMTDFFSDTTWGRTLLPLVARGNSIACEICRLAEYIPSVFKSDVGKLDAVRYADILCDFTYFSTTDYFEKRIESRTDLQDIDDEFRENHIDILERFYRVFESVYKYVTDLNRFLSSLEDGLFVRDNIVSVLMDNDGKQLMCEALYLCGVMLLLIDLKIEGPVREKMLVSYYRYSARKSNVDSNTDEVCKLLRSTGFSPIAGAKRPPDYPEAYFSRIPINSIYVDMVLDKLRSDDLYHQLKAYPLPDHRSTARATQAAMLVLCLFFAPHNLHNEPAAMREIVDKHFPDNWVISIHMGQVVNLADAWTPYRAAYTALNNTIDVANVRSLCQKYVAKVASLTQRVQNLLKEGILEPDYVLDNISRLMDVVREANVTVRWLMLHSASLTYGAESQKRCRQLREILVQLPTYNTEEVLNLLVLTSQLEFKLRQLFQRILKNKEKTWDELKKEGVDRMKELSEVFSGTKALTRVERNERLQKWFTALGDQIGNLSFVNSTAAGRKLDQLTQALREVLQFHQLESNLTVKQFIDDTCRYLQQMLRVINLQDEVVLNLNICTDISYALQIIDSYTEFMQNGIMKDPSLVLKLRATFLKLADSQDLPLVRLNQCCSKDLLSVTEYYSGDLVHYVRRVLQIIPRTMFSKLDRIIELQTDTIRELPTRLDKDKLREFAQLDDRYKVAQLTHDIAVFTQGILLMKTTLVGVIEINPHQLLEDGIRIELVNRVSRAFHDGLIFNPKAKTSELSDKLAALGKVMDGFRRSFEYIQDYVNLYGLRLWQEEVSRVINYNVERECNLLVRNKIQDWQSVYQSQTVPIPQLPSVDQSLTFVGRLVRELLRVTDPRSTVYVEQVNTWFDVKTKQELVNIKMFQKLQCAMNSFGMSSVDHLLGYMLVRQLQELLQYADKRVLGEKRQIDLLDTFVQSIKPIAGVVQLKLYSDVHSKLAKHFQALIDVLLKIGQLQLLRRHLANQLNMSCKFEGKFLYSALETLNRSALVDLRRHWSEPDTHPYPAQQTDDAQGPVRVDGTDSRAAVDPDTDFVFQLSKLLQATGMHDPLAQVYITTQRFPWAPIIFSLAFTSTLNKLTYVKNIGCLMSRRPGSTDFSVDGAPLVVGISTLLRQFHPRITHDWLALTAQFVRSVAATGVQCVKSGVSYPMEALNGIALLNQLAFYSRLPLRLLHTHLPDYLVDEVKTEAGNSAGAATGLASSA